MNIILICNEYPPAPHGGIGTFVQTMGRALTARGHRVVVLGSGPIDEERRDGDVTIRMICEMRWPPRFFPLINRWRLARALNRLVHEMKADIVEVPDYLGLLPMRFMACPVVVRLHLSATTILQHAGKTIPRMLGWFERRTLAKHRNWIGVSRYSMELTRSSFGLDPKHSTVINYPIRSKVPADPTPMAARSVLFGGGVTVRKGALVLAESARRFLARFPDCHLFYAGPDLDQDGPIEPRIRAVAGEAVSDRIHLLGALPHDQFLQTIARCDVFAFPSTLETFGLVVAEAMLCGIPVVTSDMPPFTEFVEDKRTGLLVDPKSSSAVADAIEQLLEDAALRQQLGSAAKAFIEGHFSLDRAVDRTLEFYQQVRLNGAR